MNIYPAIDLKQGNVVRLLQGKADKETIYFTDPAEPARQWKAAGAQWCHVVDLDGAFTGEPKNWNAIKKIINVGLKVQLGGGMRSESNIAKAIEAGVSRIVIGTSAVSDTSFISNAIESYPDKIAVGIDAKNGKAAVRGWVEHTDICALGLAQKVFDLGVKTIIYTDISRDGMLSGPNFHAQEKILQKVPINIIASGGVSCEQDVKEFFVLARKYKNLQGVIIGKALYEGKINLPTLIALQKKEK
jgi:phosphoribosylformimino-5-aminoimidazole carboxamide ribotide isomerase